MKGATTRLRDGSEIVHRNPLQGVGWVVGHRSVRPERDDRSVISAARSEDRSVVFWVWVWSRRMKMMMVVNRNNGFFMVLGMGMEMGFGFGIRGGGGGAFVL
ncbi:hypothetical protein Tco_0403663 [Tanacetum coccineum]